MSDLRRDEQQMKAMEERLTSYTQAAILASEALITQKLTVEASLLALVVKESQTVPSKRLPPVVVKL